MPSLTSLPPSLPPLFPPSFYVQVLMALDNTGRVVGYIVILLDNDRSPYLEAMAVIPDMLGQGVSSKLLQATHERYSKAPELRAGIREKNTVSKTANQNAAGRNGRGFEVRPWPDKKVKANRMGALKLVVMRKNNARKLKQGKRGKEEEGDDKQDDEQEEEEEDEDGKTQEDGKQDDGGSDGDKKPAAE